MTLYPFRRGAVAAALALCAVPASAQEAARLVPAFTLQAAPPSLAAPSFMRALALADLDGDGDLDLVEGRASGEVFSALNTAGPTAAPVYVRRAAAAAGLPAAVGFAAVPAAGDIDGDGDVDLVFGAGDGALRVALNTAGPGALAQFAAVTVNPYGLTSVASNAAPTLGDVDGDGDLDLLVGQTDGSVAWFENTAGPQATPAFARRTGAANPITAAAVGFSSAPTLVDLDRDGDLDVLVGNVDGVLTLFSNTAGPRATPVFAAAAPSPVGLADVGYGAVPTAADLDSDGDVDVLVGTSDGSVVSYRNDGTAGAITAVLTGTSGFRLLAAPSATATIGDLFGTVIYSQGFPGATDSRGETTVRRYTESTPGNQDLGYVAPGALTEAVGLGRGLFVYVFADEDPRPSAPGVQGGFPKTLRVSGAAPLVSFAWGAGGAAPLSFTNTGAPADDGWNLLGNPFPTSLDWDATTVARVNAAVYVYDAATASYLAHSRGIPNAGTLPGGIVGPFQGFWVQATAANPTVTAQPLASSGGPLTRGAAPATVVGLRVRPAAGSTLPAGVESQAFLALGVEGAESGVDALDARALFPPAASYVWLATQAAGADGAPVALAIDARPAGAATVDLDVRAVADGTSADGPLVLDWPGLTLPAGWSAQLVDRVRDVTVDLAEGGSYPFSLSGPADGRFALRVSAPAVAAGPEAVAALALGAPRPNPTAGGARLRLDLPEAAHVVVSAYDALGRRVAVLADATLGAGRHDLEVAAGRLAAGVYVIRADVQAGGGTQTFTQRLTVTP